MRPDALVFLGIVLAISVPLFVRLLLQSRRIAGLQEELVDRELETEKARKLSETKLSALDAENRELQQYRVVRDARATADEILQSAQDILQSARQKASLIETQSRLQATSLIEEATREAETQKSEGRSGAKSLRAEAQAALDRAVQEASRIVELAHARAEEIAGSAYDAKRNAEQYEQTVVAMKNILEGYGDRYLAPRLGLLDELAEEYSYATAATELKSARARSKLMVTNKTAADCEYVEDNRRETAISFVTDAFNGKVDSILARVKHDNAGTLAQEIRDAFTLVNHNGRAFRTARITDEYVSARLDELRWAAVVHQLRLADKEEQRRIRQQIREEAKARREYDRAIKQAEKEEGAIQKALTRIQTEMARANEEQKAAYELQVAELSEKLRVAEERSQRALSMAQQTKRGYVYIISNVGSFGENVVKIGVTRRLEPLDRVRELGDSSVPFEFDVHAMIFSEDAPALESQLHKHFVTVQMNKVNYRKEFFRVDIAHVREEVEKLGLPTKWTMRASAAEYHESLAVERAIAADPAKRERWLKRQLELDPPAQIDDEDDEDES